MKPSKFQIALEQGMQVDADLSDALDAFEDYMITPDDASAICNALKKLPRASDYENGVFFSPLSTLLSYFQLAAQQKLPAYDVLYQHGIPELIRIFESMVNQPDIYSDLDDLMKLLKMLAWYQHEDGTRLLVKAALKPFMPDEFLWHVTLDAFAKNHPHRDFVFESLSKSIPPSFLGVSLLDSANRACLEDGLTKHPFDSTTGHKRLEEFLTNRDESEFSYAVSATVALPFMSEPARSGLMALAMDHIDVSIQLQAATSSARLGSDAGLSFLCRFAGDVNYSYQATSNLVELNRVDRIPEGATSPDFRAMAEFAHWLRHPNELGKPPSSLEILDKRVLNWPPRHEPKSVYLIKYRLLPDGGCELDAADTDVGMIGSVTFALFGANNLQRSPEDVYAIHCGWEMKMAELISESDLPIHAETPSSIPSINGKQPTDLEFCAVYSFESKLGYPNDRISIYRGSLGDESGWIVIDGPRTTWYPESDQPTGTHHALIVNLHLGRVLLGFSQPVDRKAFLERSDELSDEKIIEVYEALLTQAKAGGAEKQLELLGGSGPLDKHFERYIQAKSRVTRQTETSVFVDTYEQILSLCENAAVEVIPKLFYRFSTLPTQLEKFVETKVVEKGIKKEQLIAEIFDRLLAILQKSANPQESRMLETNGILADKFEWFMQAMHATGKQARIPEIVRFFGQFWKTPMTNIALGKAAYKVEEYGLAESFLSRLTEWNKSKLRFPELGLLAQIWYRDGKETEAEDLLRTCMDNLVREIANCKYRMDLENFQKSYEQHVSTFLKLFPEKRATIPPVVLPTHPLSH